MTQSGTIEASKAFYMDPSSYAPFDYNEDHQVYELCIDPRDTNEDVPVVAYQTSGGLIGRGIDRAIVDSALGYGVKRIHTAMEQEADITRGVLEGAHRNTCKLAVGMMAVLEEVAFPDDKTLEAFDSWEKHYFESAATARDARIKAMHAAGYLLQYWNMGGYADKAAQLADELVDTVDLRQPGVHNVMTMVGQNNAGLYVVNHSATRGLRRASVFRGDAKVADTAYHDSLGRTVSIIDTYTTDEDRHLRTAATMLRSAATRQVVAPQESGLVYLEVNPTRYREAVEVVAA